MDSKQLSLAVAAFLLVLLCVVYFAYDGYIDLVPAENPLGVVSSKTNPLGVAQLNDKVLVESATMPMRTRLLIGVSVSAGIILLVGLCVAGYFLYAHLRAAPVAVEVVVEPPKVEAGKVEAQEDPNQSGAVESKNMTRNWYLRIVPVSAGLLLGFVLCAMELYGVWSEVDEPRNQTRVDFSVGLFLVAGIVFGSMTGSFVTFLAIMFSPLFFVSIAGMVVHWKDGRELSGSVGALVFSIIALCLGVFL